MTRRVGSRKYRNYLRVRGEYHDFACESLAPLELPPRARRILHAALSQSEHRGTTSACAENTGLDYKPKPGNWNYLRVRGEYPK